MFCLIKIRNKDISDVTRGRNYYYIPYLSADNLLFRIRFAVVHGVHEYCVAKQFYRYVVVWILSIYVIIFYMTCIYTYIYMDINIYVYVYI